MGPPQGWQSGLVSVGRPPQGDGRGAHAAEGVGHLLVQVSAFHPPLHPAAPSGRAARLGSGPRAGAGTWQGGKGPRPGPGPRAVLGGGSGRRVRSGGSNPPGGQNFCDSLTPLTPAARPRFPCCSPNLGASPRLPDPAPGDQTWVYPHLLRGARFDPFLAKQAQLHKTCVCEHVCVRVRSSSLGGSCPIRAPPSSP